MAGTAASFGAKEAGRALRRSGCWKRDDEEGLGKSSSENRRHQAWEGVYTANGRETGKTSLGKGDGTCEATTIK